MFAHDEGNAATAARPTGLAAPLGLADVLLAPMSQPEATRAAVPDIRALTRAVQHGDAEAFSRFYDLYSFRLYKFLLVLAKGNEDQAKEFCQTVMIKLAKRFQAFDDERRLWAWLATLSRNAFLDHCRARQRGSRLVSLDELTAVCEGQAASEQQVVELLREGVAGLPPEEQELLQAAYVDERPLQELADESGQTYKAVESRLGRLRHKLKVQLLKHLRHENES
ncbi:MAG: sigma-70 family RNA polymerase sigma factor [Verrucomicrobia bacterium]|nr:sigma-70 family RNA polymerase sigma factor [Verrucomicrobiota bacterium]